MKLDGGRAGTLFISLSSAWVFVGGMGTVILTLLVCHAVHPEDYADDLPTISAAASMAPEDTIFTLGMISVGLCIVITWLATWIYNRRNIAPHGSPALHFGNGLTLALGIAQGLSVAGLGIFTMESALELHMAASYGTFFAGSLAFLSDSLLTARWRPAPSMPLRRARLGLALAVAVVGSFFYAVFLTKGSDPFGDYMVTRTIYVGAEFILALLSFAYAPLLGMEVAAVKGESRC